MTAGDARLDAIQARLDAATSGPWEAFSSNDDYPPVTHTIITASHGDTVAALDEVDRATLREGQQSTASQDAWFIANAPADMAFLLAELREAREALAGAWGEGHGAGWNDCLLDLENGGAKMSRNPYSAAVAAANGDNL